MNSIGKSVGRNTKKIAQTVAKQMADESTEVLKTAGEQLTGQRENPVHRELEEQPSMDIQQREAGDKARSKELLQANENELEEIRIKNAQKKQQVEISEKKEKEQKEIEKAQKGQVVEPTTKRKGNPVGHFIKKIKTRVERRQPPSG